MGRLIVGVVVTLLFTRIASGDTVVVNADNHWSLAGQSHTDAILDQSTGFLWLDVTETLGLSYNQVSSMLGSGQEYEGWLLPTLADVEELLVNAGIPYPTAPPGYDLDRVPGFSPAISDFLDIFGSPGETDLGDQAQIWIGLGTPFGGVILSDGEYGALNAHRARLLVSPVLTPDRTGGSIGTFLYRPVSGVPTPSSFAALVGMGLMGLVAARRRRRRRLA